MKIAEEVKGAKGLYIIDTEQFGLSRYGAVYIIDAPKKAIIEAGLSHSVNKILNGLAELSIKLEEVAYIMCTHIHLDHAGGAGFLAEACPEAKVVLSELGADHLINPARLLESVKRATGAMFSRYGTVKPIPADRVIRVLGNGDEEFDLGDGFKLKVIDACGHAPHHACFYEHNNKGLFTGDAVGIYRADSGLLPTTPPPGFNLEKSLATLARLRQLNPRWLFFTHYGAYEEPNLLDRYANLLQGWVSEIKEIKEELKDDKAVKQHFVAKYSSSLQSHYDEVMIQQEIGMNVQGVLLYLERQRHK